ncbi:MAG: putative 4-mercaptohistidine N1-methyltransferase [Coraliomargaritaceae bacterium]
MPKNPYESDELLQQYLIFHYATPKEQFPYESGPLAALDFAKRCALEGFNLDALDSNSRVLDLGCAVGRSTFELARFCSEIIGMDYSQSFIDVANRIKEQGGHEAFRQEEGQQRTRLDISVDPVIDRRRVFFEQGDAQDIRSDIGQFDAVLACNLICRLPEPMRLMRRLPQLIKPGGQLFITTPFTWMEEYTPQENWLDSNTGDSFSGLQDALGSDFRLDRKWNMPFLIREHARKYQYSIAQASRWVRNG